MSDTTNDIDALLKYLSIASRQPSTTILGGFAADCHAALAALVAERDALKAQVLDLAFKLDGEQENRSALKRRVNELEDEQVDSDRDLRERLVCAVMTGLCADPSFDGNVVRSAIAFAEEAIAEMRKGEQNDK